MDWVLRERWPPSYSFEELKEQVDSLLVGGQLWRSFYRPVADRKSLCQGDILKIDVGLPHVDSEGYPAVTEGIEYWLHVGNTCDNARSFRDVESTQAVPLLSFGPEDAKSLRELRSYQAYRSFYVPPWSRETLGQMFVADFTRPATFLRPGLPDRVEIQARMTFRSWALLHCALVRFLARDDGRHD